MSTFITNSSEKTTLKKRLIELISKSEELKFLVGFFYFSGTQELYNTLKENPNTKLKILVGLNVDLLNFRLVEYDIKTDGENTRKLFIDSLKKSLTNKIFDEKEFYEQISFFINLLIEDRLIIKKTKDPNHSKLYIVKLNETQAIKDSFITGSSNLTKAGLETQNEFNVEILSYGIKEANEYFDKLWDSAEKLTEDGDFKKEIIEVLKNKTLIKDLTPYEAYVLILKTYLESFKQKDLSLEILKILEENKYKTYQYQMDAVKQAVSIIEQNNGVIVADVVGLGKTIIACSIAKQINKKGIIVCPPGLMGSYIDKTGWENYIEQFKLYDWKVFSRGDLENTLKYIKNTKDVDVVIVDEAHYFRNQDTKNYELLRNICRGKKVILLTATPFNNHPNDILSLLKLFLIPKKSTITLTQDLASKFSNFATIFDYLSYIKKYHNSKNKSKIKSVLTNYKKVFKEVITEIKPEHLKRVSSEAKNLSKQIRAIIEPVLIRRNRIDLKEHPQYKKEIKELSKVADPKEWFYSLTKEQSEFYDEILQKYFAEDIEKGNFNGAIYKPFMYQIGLNADISKLNEEENRQYQQQNNFFGFMRRLLVKRFESSFGSFKQSIENFKQATKNCLEFIEREHKFILDRNLIDKILEEDDPNEIKKMLEEFSKPNPANPKNNRIYLVDNFKDKNKFLTDIKSDIKLFDEILEKVKELKLVENDPKSSCIIKKIKEQLKQEPSKGEPKRKIIIFSEYLDTVDYLKNILEKEFPTNLLTISRDFDKKEEDIYKNFDASYNKQQDKYDILLCSDKLSEGFNLNRAGMIINYDIPWNPVRVIQRLGRINRISKKVFNELYIVNFFPTEKGADIVNSRLIAQNKMFLIHNTLGEDAKIFSIDEEPKASELYNRIIKNPDKNESESFYTSILNKYNEISQKNPRIIEKIKDCPPRVKVAKNGKNNELIVFTKKERLFVLQSQLAEDADINEVSFEEIYDNIKCDIDTKKLDWNTEEFWKTYNIMKDYNPQVKGSPTRSFEGKAKAKIEELLDNHKEEIKQFKPFLEILLEDIQDYGTLPEYTLRKIANFDVKDIREIEKLQNELGIDYLDKIKIDLKNSNKEIVIAVENKV